MTYEERSVILAMCLGDGYLNKNGGLYLEHSQNQEDYLIWKYNFLNKVFPGKASKIYKRERLDKRTNKVYKQVSCAKNRPYFKILRKWLYTPEKTFSRKLLDKLTAQGLAVWFMDDGNLRVNISKLTNKVSSIQLVLSIQTTKEQAEVVQTYFKERWGVEWTIYHQRNKYLLGANTKNGNKFLDIIRPYVIPSMSYKTEVIPKSARLHNIVDEDIV